MLIPSISTSACSPVLTSLTKTLRASIASRMMSTTAVSARMFPLRSWFRTFSAWWATSTMRFRPMNPAEPLML